MRAILENKNIWLDEFRDVPDPIIKWELIKYRIRQLSIRYGKNKAQNIKKKETELEIAIKHLEEELDQAEGEREQELGTKISELKVKLDEIADYKTQGLILRSQAEWHEKGEKSTKYFLQLEARNRIKKIIRVLKRDDGNLTSDEKEIMDMQARFYENLYTEKDKKPLHELEAYLEETNINKLSQEEREECEGPLTVEECQAALKSFKPNKTPGNDGLPVEFYKKFWPVIGQLCVDCFNYAYENGELSVSQRQAVITLLDKGKDRTLLKNWRPISLLNVDYKIMSKALANRCTKHLSKLICEDQVGFVKGRNITDNIRSIADILQYLKDKEEPGILIGIDFEKAFDSVSWEFMLLALSKFNFGSSFIKWIKLLYTNISSCVINNGHTSKYFDVQRGVRQGDPLSPYLFVLIVEIMANRLRQEHSIDGIKVGQKEIKILQYADDTTGFVRDVRSAKRFCYIVEEFGHYSGLKLNTEKTECMWLGSNRLNQSKPLGLLWPDRPMRILGIYFSYDQDACDELNFSNRIDKAKRILTWWATRNLTLYGRVQIIKTFIMSQFLYVTSAMPIPPTFIKRINKMVFEFIWNRGRDRLKRTTVISSVANGGLQAPDFQTMVNAARLKWIKKTISNTEAPWRYILENYLEGMNIRLNILLHSDFDVKSMGLNKSTTLPEFYKEMLMLWSLIGNTMPVDKKHFLWYNKSICIHGRSLFYVNITSTEKRGLSGYFGGKWRDWR